MSCIRWPGLGAGPVIITGTLHTDARSFLRRADIVSMKKKTLLATIIVPIQIASAVLAWRDLARRTADQVRGKKGFWRVFVSLNPGNSVIYWLVGRR
jgi:hypothetical protein